MIEHGFGITISDIEEHIKKDEERKRRNRKFRKDGETFGSELMAGVLSFDANYREEFYTKAVKYNG